MTQCLISTADIYQQECATHQQHGDDSMFLVHTRSRSPGGEKHRDDVIGAGQDSEINANFHELDEDNRPLSKNPSDKNGAADRNGDSRVHTKPSEDSILGPPPIVNVARAQAPSDDGIIGLLDAATASTPSPDTPFDEILDGSDGVLHGTDELGIASTFRRKFHKEEVLDAPDDELRTGIPLENDGEPPRESLLGKDEVVDVDDLREFRLGMLEAVHAVLQGIDHVLLSLTHRYYFFFLYLTQQTCFVKMSTSTTAAWSQKLGTGAQ